MTDLAPGAKQKFIYEYDFGDSWEHEVLVEEVLPPDPDFKHPVCLGGANACPPEDCGGSPGYAEFVDAMADPKHEQHEEMKEWVGGAWDATRFSLEARERWPETDQGLAPSGFRRRKGSDSLLVVLCQILERPAHPAPKRVQVIMLSR